MSMTVRQEPFTEEDRAAIEAQAARYLSHGDSPLVPLCVGAIGVLAAAGGFAMVYSYTFVAFGLVLGGSVIGVLGLLLAAGRRQYQRVMQSSVARLRRNAADADEVYVYEIEVQAAHIVGGGTDAADEEWSGAVVRTTRGEIVFVDVQVALMFPWDEQDVQHVPRTLEVRTLPTHDLVRVVLSDDGVEEAIALTEQDLERLCKWAVIDLEDDTPPCREIPAGIIE